MCGGGTFVHTEVSLPESTVYPEYPAPDKFQLEFRQRLERIEKLLQQLIDIQEW